MYKKAFPHLSYIRVAKLKWKMKKKNIQKFMKITQDPRNYHLVALGIINFEEFLMAFLLKSKQYTCDCVTFNITCSKIQHYKQSMDI